MEVEPRPAHELCVLTLTFLLDTQPTSGCTQHTLVSTHLLVSFLSPEVPSCDLLLGTLLLRQGLNGLKQPAPDSLWGNAAVLVSPICPPRSTPPYLPCRAPGGWPVGTHQQVSHSLDSSLWDATVCLYLITFPGSQPSAGLQKIPPTSLALGRQRFYH